MTLSQFPCVNTGSGNALVWSGNKPLNANVDPNLCRHMASLGYNELNTQKDTPKSCQWGGDYEVCVVSVPEKSDHVIPSYVTQFQYSGHVTTGLHSKHQLRKVIRAPSQYKDGLFQV